ncbi:helix-turn-helix domain-containing protein [Dysosmobacter welbionis]|uniref:helix-turn-helix domain-containing protein n=1 Tax=Dysosmobacter welbionis TaxID=2093857 RepID=UPI00205B0E58|nr:helix-turn-helix domain-containing protein [Dysosmobacter welbionis]DAO43481.1 MAG TPA: Helix-turn-helix XRE-family like protein [Caudoviricetes sp.]
MFYDKYVALCAQKGITPSAAAKEIGINKAAVSNWKYRKNGPSDVTMQKIADYFGVPVLELTEERKKAPTDEGERIVHKDKREVLAGRGISILLDADAKVTEDQLDDIVSFIQLQQRKNGR